MQDPVSQVFQIIRNKAVSDNSSTVTLNSIQAILISKGIPINAMNQCLREYSELGVLEVNDDRTVVTLITQ